MAHVTKIIAISVLFCAWSGTSAQGPEGGEPQSSSPNCDIIEFGVEAELEWPECWPACNGDQQSPIDIQTNNVTTQDLPCLNGPFIEDLTTPFNFNITNENYTATVQLLDANLYVEGGPLNGRYYLYHLQFCWGSNDSMGSDHVIDGMRYPLEAQWGLYSEEYASYDEASQHPGGILRVSQLYSIGEEENPSIAAIVKTLDSIIEPGQTTTSTDPLTYETIFTGLPVDDYYHYNGSFTSPPCTETVIWLVCPPLINVTKEQVAAFRKLQSPTGPLVDNFRFLQPLNGRMVIRSDKNTACQEGGESRVKPARRSGGLRVGTKKSRRRGSSRQHGASRKHTAARGRRDH